MKGLHLTALSAAAPALLILAASQADAQQRSVGGGPRNHLVGNWGGMHPILGSRIHGRGKFGMHGGGFHGGKRGFHGGGHGFHGGKGGFHGGGFFVVEQEVPVIIEVGRDDKPAAQPVAPAAPKPPMKPYVIGSSYDSLPGGCMKLIEDGASYYYCSGEWYRQVRDGRNPLYKAVARGRSL